MSLYLSWYCTLVALFRCKHSCAKDSTQHTLSVFRTFPDTCLMNTKRRKTYLLILSWNFWVMLPALVMRSSKMSLHSNFRPICDMIKENESLVYSILFSYTTYLVTELWRICRCWKQYKTKEFEHCFCQYLKNNITDIWLIPLDHVTIT